MFFKEFFLISSNLLKCDKSTPNGIITILLLLKHLSINTFFVKGLGVTMKSIFSFNSRIEFNLVSFFDK